MNAKAISTVSGFRVILVVTTLLLTVLMIPGGFAISGPVYKNLNLYHPGSYDYVPSIMYDRDERRWKAWWCGSAQAGGVGIPGDGIFYAYSWDKVNWTAPQLVFSGQYGQTWDNLHTCDPSVIKHPIGTLKGWTYVMYYNGASSDPSFQKGCSVKSPSGQPNGCNNMVGIATSFDGVHWQRYSGNPILNCSSPSHYGCGQFSVTKSSDLKEYRITYLRDDGSDYNVHRVESKDGITLINDFIWPTPPPPNSGIPGLDIMYDKGTNRYFGVFTYNNGETLWSAPFGGSWSYIQTFGGYPGYYTYGSGFFRTQDGWNPGGPVWSAYGTPPFTMIPHDYNQQELKAVQWGL